MILLLLMMRLAAGSQAADLATGGRVGPGTRYPIRRRPVVLMADAGLGLQT